MTPRLSSPRSGAAGGADHEVRGEGATQHRLFDYFEINQTNSKRRPKKGEQRWCKRQRRCRCSKPMPGEAPHAILPDLSAPCPLRMTALTDRCWQRPGGRARARCTHKTRAFDFFDSLKSFDCFQKKGPAAAARVDLSNVGARDEMPRDQQDQRKNERVDDCRCDH